MGSRFGEWSCLWAKQPLWQQLMWPLKLHLHQRLTEIHWLWFINSEMQEVQHKPCWAKFSKSNLKLPDLFHTISPHLTLSFAKNFSLLGLFSFHFTSANMAQNYKQLHSTFPPLRWGVFPTRKQAALCRNKANHSLADWKNQWPSYTLCFSYIVNLISCLIQQNLFAFSSTSSSIHDICNALQTRACSLKTKVTWCM